ncbi:MAG: PhzF family phenazine biosynthesis protein [Candidatus Saccharibacteria bacterium]
MDYKNTAQFLRVFVDLSGKHGDLASVVIDEGHHISDDERQQITRELNTGETAFVNNLAKADISIMHPQGEIDFAGVAALGTAWLLTKLSHGSIGVMKGRGGYITVSRDKDHVGTDKFSDYAALASQAT